MSHQILLLLAVLTLGLATSQQGDKVPCKMVNKEVSCQCRGLVQVPLGLPRGTETLDLSGNQLQSILASPLGLYTALRHLDLSANEISFLQPGVFRALSQLERLNLAHNRLALSAAGLGPLPHLTSLDLSGNSLYSGLVEQLLGEAPALRTLALAENSLTRLARQTFGGTPALERLDLHSNVLMDIEDGAFEALPRLTHLNLSRNSLTCISDFSLPQLRVLDLSCNSIEAFQMAPGPPPRAGYQLAWLDLRENKLLRLPDLAALPALLYLNVSNNLISLPAGPPPGGTAIHAPAEGWSASPPVSSPRRQNASAHPVSQLLNLDLSYNEIELVPEGFLEPLASLRFLNLSRNCLRAFEARRAGSLPCLVLLDVSHNALDTLELGARALGSLRTLLLQHNALRGLPPRTFAGPASLQRLNLQGNRVIPCGGPGAPGPSGCVDFSGISSLRSLNLVDNEVERLRAGAFLRTPLTQLDLSFNPGLDVAAGALAGLEASLEALALQGGGLQALQVDLPRFRCLRRLNLAGNRLSRLPAWTQAVALEVLDLRNNSFSLLPGSAMGGLEASLRRLYLRGNPLRCCGNGWLAAQLHRGRVDVDVDADADATRDLVCRFDSQEEVLLSHVRPEDCEKGGLRNVNLVVVLTFTLVSAAALAMLATCCCVRQHKFSQQYKA